MPTGQKTASRRGKGHDNRSKNDPAPLLPILARRVREVEGKAAKGKVGPTNRVKFQVIALLVRQERTRIKSDESVSTASRTELLKRLDGVATILARTAAQDTSLLSLLDPDDEPGPAAQQMRNKWLLESGAELTEEELKIKAPQRTRSVVVPAALAERQVVPKHLRARRRLDPFLEPNLALPAGAHSPGYLSGWDLMGPLYRAFEEGSGGAAASMALPAKPRKDWYSPAGLELMPHQSRLLEAVRRGHRNFLLADEPGLGKTAQSVLAASVANTYPMLAVVPNVVKINWAREVARWTPQRTVTVINGDGDDMNIFADVFVINYAILDRHLSWLSELGLKSLIVDEAHFIKNLTSQRSQHVLNLARRIRERCGKDEPLLMALTGTPLINDVEDFNAIWQFLGWTAGEAPSDRLRHKLEMTGLTPADRDFYPKARSAVIDMGIVRRTKAEVASDLPDKRVADLPVDVDNEIGRSIKAAERELAHRLVQRYYHMLESGVSTQPASAGPDIELLRRIARTEVESASPTAKGDNVFTMVRRIGQAKAPLAADYTAQLAHSVGKVVFFAKHVDVMDTVEDFLAEDGIRTVSIRGNQSSKKRQEAIDAFQKDPDVKVIVCSLKAAGVGLNLHAASNVVLGELSWTAAEQQQAIDRVHRIGQDRSVTAWRILAAHTLDTKIAELIDAKKSLAARALDGSDDEIVSSETVQVEALVQLMLDALG